MLFAVELLSRIFFDKIARIDIGREYYSSIGLENFRIWADTTDFSLISKFRFFHQVVNGIS